MVQTNAAISQLYTASAIQSFGRLCALIVRHRSRRAALDTMVFVRIYVYLSYFEAAFLLFAAFAKVLTETNSAVTDFISSFQNEVYNALVPFFPGFVLALGLGPRKLLHLLISGLAILNLAKFERRHSQHIEDISPKLKFFSTKVLLTFEWLNAGLVVVVKSDASLSGWGLSEIHQMLYESVLMCFEMAVLSGFYMWCWSAEEPWYDEVEKEGETSNRVELAEPLRAG
jgi:hypothetical protein